MEINGKIIEILPENSGESAKGPWRKQEYILETEGQYPKKVCFMAWGDKIGEFAIKEGANLVVSVDLESREYNGRWYTDVKAWKVTQAGAAAPAAARRQWQRRARAPRVSTSALARWRVRQRAARAWVTCRLGLGLECWFTLGLGLRSRLGLGSALGANNLAC